MSRFADEPFRRSVAGLDRLAKRARSGLSGGRAPAGQSAIISAIRQALGDSSIIPSVAWTEREAHGSDTGVTIVPIGPPGEPARLIIKFADSPIAIEALRAQGDRLDALHADPRLTDWATIAPKVLFNGVTNGVTYSVETALDGTPATKLVRDPQLHGRLLPAAAEAISGLHGRSAVSVVLDEVILDDWIGSPVRAMATGFGGRGGELRSRLEGLGRELHAEFIGEERSIGWIHGDYWPGNILLAADGSRVTGIVDWNLSSDGQWPLIDPAYLILTIRRLVTGRELGDVVCGLLAGDVLQPAERSALAAVGFKPADWEREIRSTVLLSWLRHVAFATMPGDASNPRWVRQNVLAVLDAMPRSRPVGGPR